MNTLTTINAEKEDLSTHVDLCAQRYKDLDSRLGHLEAKVDKISDKIDQIRPEISKILIGTAGTILVALISALGVFLSHIK